MGWVLAVNIATPFLYAGATAIIGAATYILTRFGGAVMDDRIDPKLKPFYDRLDQHLKVEEADRAETRDELRNIHHQLVQIRDNENDDHRRLWHAIEDLKGSK